MKYFARTISAAALLAIAACSGHSGSGNLPASGDRLTPKTVNPCSPGYAGTVLCDNPRQFYELNETGGTTAFDWSKSAQNGTYTGPFTLGATPAPVAGDNAAVSMPGSNGTLVDVGVSVPSPNFTSGTSWTMETWVYPKLPASTYDTADQTIWGYGGSDRFLYGQNNKLLLQLGTGSCTSTATVANQAWSLVDVVYDASASQATFYINGQPDATCSFTNAGAAITSAYYIGEYANNNVYYKWSGMLGMHAAYPSALSAARIAAHYNARLTQSPVSEIALMQIFDETSYGTISASAAAADGPRYDVVWGVRPGFASTWLTNAPALHASYYVPMETDASQTNWGALGHNLAWWQTNHPTWIDYACDTNGNPTRNVAYQSGWTNQVPLDISNPAVQQYQFSTWLTYASGQSYNAIAADEVLLSNSQVQGTGSTYLYDCGTYDTNNNFVRRYQDPRKGFDAVWAQDTINWVSAFSSYLNTSYPAMAFIINTYQEPVDSSTTGTYAKNLLAAMTTGANFVLDEAGITAFGKYGFSHGTFLEGVNWAQYAQQHNMHMLMNAEFLCPGVPAQPPNGQMASGSCTSSSQITSTQREYAIATYLMSDFGAEDLMAGPSSQYGREMYYQTEYQTNYGIACGPMTTTDNVIYTRRYSNALVIVNTNNWENDVNGTYTNTAPTSYTLPHAASTYTDLEQRTVTSPLSVAAADAYVLLTTNGCN